MRVKPLSGLAGSALLVAAMQVCAQGAPDEGNLTHEIHRTSSVATEPAATSTDNDGNTALVRIDHFQVNGNTLLDAGQIEYLLAPYTGNARSYTDIQRALEELEGAYRSAGYSAVHVVTPEQEITAGIITFQVIESVIGKVVLTGNKHYDKNNIRNALPALSEGSTPSARALSENLRLANENPTRQLDVVLALGEEDNTVDAQVNVQDSSPRKLFLTLDNTGSASTGMYRTGVGYQHNNLFNRDHAATFNYITSPNHIKDVTQLSASYRIPFYALGDSLDLVAAYSNVNAGTTSTVSGPLTFSGQGRVYSAHYNHYLPRQGEYTSTLISGLDYRVSINNCSLGTFGAAGCGSAAADVTVHPLSLSYSGAVTQSSYVGDYTLTVARNLAGGANGGPADFDAVRPSPIGGAGAPADYTIWRFNGSLAGILPQSWQYRIATNLQDTRTALVSGESLGLVGANAVRGFPEREVSNDKGYILNLELYTPELASHLGIKDGSFRGLGFIDRAKGWNVPLAGESVNYNSVGSVGVGFRYTHGKNIMLKFDWARVSAAGAICTCSGGSRTGDKRGQIGLVANW